MPIPFIWIALAACIASLITFFSGFGLGTLLMPIFALFFPVNVAVAATAVVHLANNLFKALLVGRHVHVPTLLRFGIPAAIAALGGAYLLSLFAELPKMTFTLGSYPVTTTPLNLLIGLLITGFSLLELWPRFQHLAFPPRLLALGGLLSGFFGGLSGHQGAFRSAFLIRSGLDKQTFIATAILSAVVVDVVRLFVYGVQFWADPVLIQNADLIITAVLAAFAGTLAGSRLLRKTTLDQLHQVIGILLALIGLGLMLGII